jgi:hypothetical protein
MPAGPRLINPQPQPSNDDVTVGRAVTHLSASVMVALLLRRCARAPATAPLRASAGDCPVARTWRGAVAHDSLSRR